MQVEAAKKLGELFPNREGITTDLAEEAEPEVPEEDETAGNLGLPFTAEPPPGEEEEWVDWVTTGSTGRVWPRDGRRAGDPRRKSAFLPS